MSAPMDDRTRQWFLVLTWAVGILAGLMIAMLGNTLTMSYQLGQTIGRLDVLIDHVVVK